jgi:hypothetical protein
MKHDAQYSNLDTATDWDDVTVKPASQGKRQFAMIVAALSAVYMFVPEPTDLIPILGWLDEGVAAMMLMWALKTLRVAPQVATVLQSHRRR